MGDLAGLGRLYKPDDRDKRYALKPKPATGIDRRMWYPPTVLDQGNTSECVGHATRSWLSAGPVVNRGGPDQHQIYHEAQKVDEWPGEDYDGTSVRGAMKVLVAHGLAGEYHWAQTVDDIVNHVLTVGPVIMGTDWTIDMCDPDKHGFIQPTGRSVGGHAWLVLGVDRWKKAARIQNSWGRNWGPQHGRAWILLEHLAILLANDGEAAVPIELKA